MCPLQSQKRSVQNEKCGRCKSREDSPLESECFPEHVPIPERPEPEHVHVIRKRGPTAEDNAGKEKEDEKEKETTATARPCRMRRRPVNRLWHCSTPFSLTSYSYPHNTPSASAGRLMAPSHRTVARRKHCSLLKGSLRWRPSLAAILSALCDYEGRARF